LINQAPNPQERIRSLLEARTPLYADIAHLVFDTGAIPATKVARALLRELKHQHLV